MGLITDLIQQRHEGEWKKKEAEIGGLRSVLSNEDATPEAKEWAIDNIMNLAGGGKSGGKNGGSTGSTGSTGKDKQNPFRMILSHLAGLNPYGIGQQTKDQLAQVEQSRPQQLLMSPERQQKQQEEQQARLLQQQKAVALQKQQLTLAADQQDWEQRNVQAEKLGLVGQQKAEYIAKRNLPGPPQPKAPTAAEQTQQTAFKAKADALGKTVDELTAQEKVSAIKDFKEGTRLSPQLKTTAKPTSAGGGGNRSTGSAGSTGMNGGKATPVEHKAAQQANQYTPGGKSFSNPTVNPTIEGMAWSWLTEGKIPFTGMGNGGNGGKGQVNKRESAIGRAYELAKDLGIEPWEITAHREQLKKNATALGKITSTGAMIGQFERTLAGNLEIARKLDSEFKRGNIPLLNKVVSAFKTGRGDPEALNLAGQLHGISREWGKIMQGSTGAAGVPVSEANASEFITNAATSGQLNSFFDNVIIPDAKSRKNAIEAEKQDLIDQIKGEFSPRKGGTDDSGGSGGAVGAVGTQGAKSGATGSQALPKPNKPGQRLSVDQAREYLQAVGGDKQKAKEKAKADGWSF